MNKFFNSETYSEEVLGYIEDFVDAETGQYLGYRKLNEPTRPCGSPGRLHLTLTEDLFLFKGYKRTVKIVKASKQCPRKVIATILILSGRKKEKKLLQEHVGIVRI
jgi:hypothetical protein